VIASRNSHHRSTSLDFLFFMMPSFIYWEE